MYTHLRPVIRASCVFNLPLIHFSVGNLCSSIMIVDIEGQAKQLNNCDILLYNVLFLGICFITTNENIIMIIDFIEFIFSIISRSLWGNFNSLAIVTHMLHIFMC